MTVTAVRTPLIDPGADLAAVIRASLTGPLPDRCVVVVASKIVSIAEGRLTGTAGDREHLHRLVRAEAEHYLEPHSSRYGVMLTIKGNWMFVNAGIDQSNAAGRLALWPRDPQRSVNELWRQLREHTGGRRRLGLVMADSGGVPLNWGVIGRGIAHCGFQALRSYVGAPDLYGRPMTMEKTNLVQSIAAAAVLEMGEGSEQTPVAVVGGIGNIRFQQREPTAAELCALRIALEDDVYAPLLTSVPWQRGGGGA